MDASIVRFNARGVFRASRARSHPNLLWIPCARQISDRTTLHDQRRSCSTTTTYTLRPSPSLPSRPPHSPLPSGPGLSKRAASKLATRNSPYVAPTAGRVNPPSSTLPAPLDLPTKPEDGSDIKARVKYLFAIGKAYLTFYKIGMKNVYANYKLLNKVAKRLDIQPYRASAARQARLQHLAAKGTLSRSDFQLLERTRADIKKLPLFGLMIAICGEFTPLVVLATGNAIVPRTCHFPGLVKKHNEAIYAQRKEIYGKHGVGVGVVDDDDDHNLKIPHWVLNSSSKAVKNMTPEQTIRLSVVLGLAKRDRRWLSTSPILGNLALLSWYRPRLTKRLAYLELDDKLLSNHATLNALRPDELKIAAEERGIIWAPPQSDSAVIKKLESWLHARM